MAHLCVNIDHIATLREARGEAEPDPVQAVGVVERAGSTGVTVHLREDRRHIKERDVRRIRQVVQGRLNLEMAATAEMCEQALTLTPDLCTLVPEKRQELTTEGGLDVAGQSASVMEVVRRLQSADIAVSLFIDPDTAQIEASVDSGAQQVELHTGQYAHAFGTAREDDELKRLERASDEVRRGGLILNAGHGLNYRNVRPVAAIDGMCELNIGHAIVSRAVFSGLERAVAEMVALIDSV